MADSIIDKTFILSVFGVLAACTFFSYWVSRWYTVEKERAIRVRVDPFMTACNSGITVAGISVPLLVSLFAYIRNQTEQFDGTLSNLAISITLIFLSIFFGLWVLYSFVALGGEDGICEIDKDRSTFLPSLLAMQLALLLAGFVFLVVCVLFYLS